MAAYEVNDAAVVRARELIAARQYVLDSEWGEAQPDAAAQNAYLQRHSWQEYAAWHLVTARRDRGCAAGPAYASVAGVDHVQDLVETMRREAAAAMSELSGDVSACALARDGRSFPAFKFHEGRAAALGELRRRLRREDVEPAMEIDLALGRWHHERELAEARGGDWRAYAAGGVDALETLRESTTGPGAPGPCPGRP